jgi:hypothetical protein
LGNSRIGGSFTSPHFIPYGICFVISGVAAFGFGGFLGHRHYILRKRRLVIVPSLLFVFFIAGFAIAGALSWYFVENAFDDPTFKISVNTRFDAVPPLPPAPSAMTFYFRAFVNSNTLYATRISLLLNAAITNRRSSPAIIANMSVETAGKWPWSGWTPMCFVSLLPDHGQLASGGQYGHYFTDEGTLERSLPTGKAIGPHETVEGLTAWECASKDCNLKKIRFVMKDAEGGTSIQYVPPIDTDGLSSFAQVRFRVGGIAPFNSKMIISSCPTPPAGPSRD